MGLVDAVTNRYRGMGRKALDDAYIDRMARRDRANDIKVFDGQSLKTIAFESAEDWLAWTQGKDASRNPYASSAWYYACVTKRAAMTRAVPRILRRADSDGDDIKDTDLPFQIDLGDLMYRSSVSLDRYAAAYWAKIRSGQDGTQGQLRKVKLLDPTTIEPIYDQRGGGLIRFERSIAGKVLHIEYDPLTEMSPLLGWVWLLGLNEDGPGMAPEDIAKRPANILANIDRFAENFFERGAIAQHWITSTQNPGPEEKERLVAKIKRALFGGVDTSHNVEVFSEGLTVDKVGSDPKDLELGTLDESNMVDVGAVLETPRLIINPDSAANRSMLDRTWASWIDYTIVPHADLIVTALNKHILEPEGYTLELNPHAMTISQEEERQRAQAFTMYITAGAEPDTVAAMLGLDIPEGMELMAEEDKQPIPPQLQPSFTPEPEEQEEERDEGDEDEKALELARLRRYVKNGTHQKRPFASDILTGAEIATEVGAAQDAPFLGWQGYP
jgi:hypothetical protein